MSEVITKTLNARRLLCPMPVIRTQAAIKDCQDGDVLQVICTDHGAKQDIPTWCRMYGHEVLKIVEADDEISIIIRVSVTQAAADTASFQVW